MLLYTNDLEQIENLGMSVSRVERQLENFRTGFPFLHVRKVADVSDGIAVLSASSREKYRRLYESASAGKRIVKFVPASGAATRMFKELYEFVGEGRRTAAVDKVLSQIDKFAFYPQLEKLLPASADDRQIINAIIGDGLAYGSKPKAMVLFHRYGDGSRTAIEEHLAEGAQYAAADGVARLHFTVSPEHKQQVAELLNGVLPQYEKRYGIRYDISFSEQKASTDTIAVNPDNTPFRNEDGSLLFRPAGHGALIENLNAIDADIIFIKNIDNVTTESQRGDTVEYKHVLAGLLLDLQNRCHEILRGMDAGEADMAQVARFIEQRLCVKLPEEYYAEMLRSILDRPIRVCGMVRNDGEPGGGPFWVANPDKTVSLQIAESSQISPEDSALLKQATHFNPVDLVCGVKDYKGRKFDLTKFTDPDTGFISEKSKDGRPLRAQELPGLWNGAMARWNTVFVQVPISTFTPVKVVCDLLRPQHQPVEK